MENKQTAEKLTAMEQLINWIDSDCSPMDCIMKAKELLAIEKEQISNGYYQGLIDGMNNSPREYYEETYGTQLPKE